MTVDEALTTGKATIEGRFKKLSQDFLTELGVGVRILSSHLQKTVPPVEVAKGFHEVINAWADKMRIINEARTIAQTRLSRARTQSYETISESKAGAETRIRTAEGKCQSLARILASPDAVAYAQRLYLDVLRDVLPKMKKVMVPPESKDRVTTIK